MNDPNRMSNGIRVLKSASTGLKVIEKRLMATNDHQFERAKAEIAVLKQIKAAGGSPNVNVIYDEYWEEGSQTSVLTLEYCDSQTLGEMIEKYRKQGIRFDEDFLWHIIEGMLTALAFCHNGVRNPGANQYKFANWNTICHLDIKPGNVFLTTRQIPGYETYKPYGRIVLGDFGCSVTLDDIKAGRQVMGTMPGATQGWTPPEIKYSQDAGGYRGTYGKGTDIWQMGGMVQVMARVIAEPNQSHVQLGRPCGAFYSSQLNHVIAAAMEPDHHKRPSALDLWDVVALKKREWEKLQPRQ